MDNYINYERPSVATDIAAFGIDSERSGNRRELDDKKLKILLVRRGEEPFKDKWALAGGFLRPGETVEEAAHRELKEETGLAGAKLIPLKPYSEGGRDPRGWIVSCAYIALTRTIELNTEENSDAESASWMTIEMVGDTIFIDDGAIGIRLENGRAVSKELAFDHAQIIHDAYLKLQDEVQIHDLIFDLLPEFFTIADLQKPYELITGKQEAAANFRRKMAKKIEETEMYDKGGAMHRPSKLYKRRNEK